MNNDSNRKSESISLKRLLVILGSVFVALGVLGIFIPLLPTTPFLLLAAACYAKSSDRFYNWLINNRWLGKYIKNYREGKGMTLRAKVTSLILLYVAIGYSGYYVAEALWIRLILAIIVIGVTLHLLTIPTFKNQ
ncbi:MAG: DUF454 family protein [candidate division Zixibacteria bacterium]|nr:DUF454 family protein [candidate division Zixibacteria bacterium]